MLKLGVLMKIHLLREGQPYGPFSAETIREMVKLGVVFESDLARYDGATEWITLSRLCDFHPPESSAPLPADFEGPTKPVSAETGKPEPLMILATLGGLVVAGAGGWIWTEAAVAADREFRIIALLIASGCAGAVIFCSPGGRGPRFQWLACAATLLGILLGKSGVAWHLMRLTREAEATAPDVGSWTTLPGVLSEVFARHLPQIFGASDLLWILLALFTAWKIPEASAREG